MRTAWNKGLIEYKKCKVCENKIRKWRVYCSKKCMYINRAGHISENLGRWAKKGSKPWNTGKSMENYPQCGFHKGMKGFKYWENKKREDMRAENHFNWKGGVTPKNIRLRLSLESKIWRKEIFKKDNFKCVVCNKQGYLQADHKKPWSLFPSLRFEISNGQTLCKECHLIKTQLDRKLFNNFKGGEIIK